jgi:hypothetical protein
MGSMAIIDGSPVSSIHGTALMSTDASRIARHCERRRLHALLADPFFSRVFHAQDA